MTLRPLAFAASGQRAYRNLSLARLLGILRSPVANKGVRVKAASGSRRIHVIFDIAVGEIGGKRSKWERPN